MKRILYATAISLLPAAAMAQAVVVCPLCNQELTAVLNDVLVAANWVSQLHQMEQQIQQDIAIYNSLAHLNENSLTTAAGLLNNAVRLPGSDAAAMPGLNYGANLSGYGQQYYNQNRYYTPPANNWNAQEMQRRAYATANLQGEAQAGMEAAHGRLADLAALEAEIPKQPDVTAVAAFDARINAEKMQLANESNNIQHLQLLQQTQGHVDQQRAEEHSRQMADNWNDAVAAQAWGQ